MKALNLSIFDNYSLITAKPMIIEIFTEIQQLKDRHDSGLSSCVFVDPKMAAKPERIEICVLGTSNEISRINSFNQYKFWLSRNIEKFDEAHWLVDKDHFRTRTDVSFADRILYHEKLKSRFYRELSWYLSLNKLVGVVIFFLTIGLAIAQFPRVLALWKSAKAPNEKDSNV